MEEKLPTQTLAQGERQVQFMSAQGVLALALKRGVDLAGAVIGIIFLSPFLCLTALLVKWDSPGPVVYKRRAMGRRGYPFMVYKFRTMVNDAHDMLSQNPALMQEYQRTLKIVQDPRVTRLGRVLRKSSLDELPQLFNVLRGEMSLVGPRVLGDIELERYGANKEKVLSVKPGISGLWQVSGRHTVSFERRMELDLEYVDRWNLWLDFKILVLTIPAVLTGKGAG